MNLFINNFLNNHPEHAARLLSASPPDIFLDLVKQHPQQLEKLISNISPTYLAGVFETHTKSVIEFICPFISAPYIASILRLVKKSKQEMVLDSIDREKKPAILELLVYSSEQIGYYLDSTELILSENLTPPEAIAIIENIPEMDHPIYVVDNNYCLKGKVNLFKLIKVRNDPSATLDVAIDKKVTTFKASIAIKNITTHPGWSANSFFPVLGKSDILLGVISRKSLSLYNQKEKIQSKQDNSRTSLNEYIHFSELLWSGLQKFWGSLR